jgi:RNA polymerase sigma-70 factor (ECF subfamily)
MAWLADLEGTHAAAAVSNPSNISGEVTMASGEIAFHATDALAGGAAVERGLVEQCRRGDAHAFARLVALHEGMVFNLAARLLGDAEEARDASQDVFLQVYRTLGRFEGRSTLKTWIYRIVVNNCRNRRRWWRRRRKDRSLSLESMTPADEARVADHRRRPSPYEQVRQAERARKVQTALSRLSFDHRAILLLREVEGLTCEDVAGALGLPQGTVKSRLSRAREALRVALAGTLDGDESERRGE